jgi:hypothetical protein
MNARKVLPASTTERVLIPRDRSIAIAPKDLPDLDVKLTSMNAIRIHAKMKEHVLMKEGDFVAYACQAIVVPIVRRILMTVLQIPVSMVEYVVTESMVSSACVPLGFRERSVKLMKMIV